MSNKSVYFVTLGCSKNDVDTNIMKSVLSHDKYDIAESLEDANIIIVNTCGFIEDAKQESIDMIFDMIQFKEEHNCEYLIASGCLAQRYPEELLSEIPELDGILGTGQLGDINKLLDSILNNERDNVYVENINSEYVEGVHRKEVGITEYVKISEGCNNNCTYCIIPALRGKNRSRKIEDIHSEVENLVERGTREIILIAQNTSDYGINLYNKYNLHELINKLSEIEDLKWIRVLYLYPDNFSDELINEFKTNSKLLPYVDIPLQHISNNVLKRMNRHTNKDDIINLLNKLRNNIQNIVIRTTFIVGFPGETESDFNELNEFIQEYPFDKLGVFSYSREEGTPAYKMDSQIDEETKEIRRSKIMETQKTVSEKLCQRFIDREFEALVEEVIDDTNYVGRIYSDSPEIDGVLYIESDSKLEIGSFIKVKIIDSLEYDLIGEYIDERSK